LTNASAALEQGSYDTALHIFTQAQQLSTQESDAAMQAPAASSSKEVQHSPPAVDLKMAQVGQGMALHGCAACYRAVNDLPKAQECYTESLRALTKGLGSHHPELAAVWNNLGSLQSQMNRMPAALECYEHAMDVLKAQNSRFGSLHLSKVPARRLLTPMMNVTTHPFSFNTSFRFLATWLLCIRSRVALPSLRDFSARQPASARTICNRTRTTFAPSLFTGRPF
jgi:tetratricopeptide (TPR) repeat protein